MLPGIRNVGLRNYGRFRMHRFRDKLWPCEKLLSLRVDGIRYPLKARGGSSDLSVYSGVFVRRDYSCLDHVKDAQLIIDCGANVGYSPAYFLSRFPKAHLIAVEPDATNFELLRENLAPYGDRAQMVQAGVWSHSTELTVVDAPYRDGRQWSQQFRERQPGEKAVICYGRRRDAFGRVGLFADIDLEDGRRRGRGGRVRKQLSALDRSRRQHRDRASRRLVFRRLFGDLFEGHRPRSSRGSRATTSPPS